MIPRSFIEDWREEVPWLFDVQVEQDLLIAKSLIAVFKDPFLKRRMAVKGGTAFYKLHLKTPVRFTENLDLVILQKEEVQTVCKRLREVLSFLGTPVKEAEKEDGTVVYYRFRAEDDLETPLSLRFAFRAKTDVFSETSAPVRFNVQNPWFSDSVDVLTFSLDELLAEKAMALYQRDRGRDLFDLHQVHQQAGLPPLSSVSTFKKGMGAELPSSREFMIALEHKMERSSFLGDVGGLLGPDRSHDPWEAYAWVRDEWAFQLG